MRSEFDALLTQAPAMPELPSEAADLSPVGITRTAESQSPSRWGAIAAAVLVASVVSSAGTYYATRSTVAAPGWIEYVAAYQALYTTDTLRHIKSDADNDRAELIRVSDAIDRPIDIAQLSALPGLTYKRAQMLGFRGKPLAQLTFLSDSGEPVAVCIIKSGKDNSALQDLQLEGMPAAKWVKNGHAFLVIGGSDQGQTRLIAENVATLI